MSTLAGSAGSYGSTDGTGSAAQFYQPEGVAVDSTGNVYVADTGNQTIRKITAGGAVSTLAGLAGNDGSADGTGTNAQFYGLAGVAVDGLGSVFVSDYFNQNIRKVTPAGEWPLHKAELAQPGLGAANGTFGSVSRVEAFSGLGDAGAPGGELGSPGGKEGCSRVHRAVYILPY